MKNIHTLILPDIHGRNFWKSAIEMFPKDQYPNLNIVFLGDYLDPYDFEGISRLDAIENFKEIIKKAKSDERIHLLIGNHDMHYWYDARHKSRVDVENYNTIKDIFLKDFTLFNIAYEENINNERYLYTHAGVTNWWYKHLQFVGENSPKVNKNLKEDRIEFCKMIKNITPTAEELNKMKLDFQGQALLWCASWIRGGDDNCGSCIWADFEEWCYEGSNIPGLWQIFAHTLAAFGFDEGYVDKEHKIAMLDSRQAWVIDNQGNIIKLKELI